MIQALPGRFVIANLGAGGDADYDLPTKIRKTATLIEIDAGNQAAKTGESYYAKHGIKKTIAGTGGVRKFFNRKLWLCSSLHDPDEKLIKKYGLEDHYGLLSVKEVEVVTFPEVLRSLGIETVDFLKTDIEGEDFAVIRSCIREIPGILAIQCELRFEPFYRGEPFFHEVAAFLHENDFELIGLRPEYWKPKTAHRHKYKDGRIVWVDCLFLRNNDSVKNLPGKSGDLMRAKQVLIASMLGKKGHAAWLLDCYRENLPGKWADELRPVVEPRYKRNRMLEFDKSVLKIVEAVSNKPFIGSLIAPLRRKGFTFVHVADSRDNT